MEAPLVQRPGRVGGPCRADARHCRRGPARRSARQPAPRAVSSHPQDDLRTSTRRVRA
jgi:hypothetical protein